MDVFFILKPSHTNKSIGGVRTRGQLAAQRPPKLNSVGRKRKEERLKARNE